MLRSRRVSARLKRSFTAKLDITPESVLREWRNVAFANMQDYTRIDEDGNPIIDLSECTREQMAASRRRIPKP